jgi:hypothetical protein
LDIFWCQSLLKVLFALNLVCFKSKWGRYFHYTDEKRSRPILNLVAVSPPHSFCILQFVLIIPQKLLKEKVKDLVQFFLTMSHIYSWRQAHVLFIFLGL